jgi:drug/metabolite transporter (DMT)-like permease
MRAAKPGAQHRPVDLGGIALVNLATIIWATNMALGRWLRNDIGPLTLAASRFLIGSVFLALLLRQRPIEERRLGSDRWLLLAMALTGVVVFTPLLYLGLRFTTAVNATLINGLGPLITGLVAIPLSRERMSRRQLAGAILGLAGVLILISGGSLAFLETVRSNVGDLIILAAVTLWGLYSVLGQRAMRYRSALSATAFSAFLGLPFLLVAAAIEIPSFPPAFRLELIPIVLYIGIAPTLGGFLAWNEGVRRLGSSGAMVFYNTLPLYGALLGGLFLAEPVGLSHLLGGALIIGGGIWATNAFPVSFAQRAGR